MQAASGKTVLTVGSGAVLAPVLVWVAGLLGVDMPLPVATAIGGILAGIVAYLVPAKEGKYVTGPGDEGWDRRIDGSMADYATEDEAVEVEDN